MPRRLDPLLIEMGESKIPDADLVRRHAEGLAREIQADVMAKEDEIADAIEHAIRRFARREWQRIGRGRRTGPPSVTTATRSTP